MTSVMAERMVGSLPIIKEACRAANGRVDEHSGVMTSPEEGRGSRAP